MLWFQRAEVYVGYSLQDFSRAKETLAQHQIPYDYHIDDRSQSWTGRGTARAQFGSPEIMIGQNTEQLYYVYVRRRDRERAQQLIDEVIRA